MIAALYASKVPSWIYPNFEQHEIACDCCGELLLNFDAMEKLQALRDRVGPLTINSAYRCPQHNKDVGGSPNSYHKLGRAFDIALTHDMGKLIQNAREVGFTGFGMYTTFLHVDTGPARTWGKHDAR